MTLPHYPRGRREEGILSKHSAAIAEAKKAEARLAERFRQAGTSQQAAEERAVQVGTVSSGSVRLEEAIRGKDYGPHSTGAYLD